MGYARDAGLLGRKRITGGITSMLEVSWHSIGNKECVVFCVLVADGYDLIVGMQLPCVGVIEIIGISLDSPKQYAIPCAVRSIDAGFHFRKIRWAGYGAANRCADGSCNFVTFQNFTRFHIDVCSDGLRIRYAYGVIDIVLRL